MSEQALANIAGRIFDIQLFSIHDGPGIRTTVFMKGCPLDCAWCHNPEGISPSPQLSFLPDRCIGCGYCLRVCRQQAHKMADAKHILDRSICIVCGACARECYAQALEIVGQDVSVQQVIDEALRDKPFYETSGGGITLSGGEPTMQIDFAEAVLRAAKEASLHCCVETCGFCEFDRLQRLTPLVDLFLYDYKETDPQRHAQYIGVPNDRVIANLRSLHAAGSRIRLRCPIIPGLNDRDDHYAGIVRLAGELTNLEGVELMPYHRLGESKLQRLGMDDRSRLRPDAPQPRAVQHWISLLRDQGVKVLQEAG